MREIPMNEKQRTELLEKLAVARCIQATGVWPSRAQLADEIRQLHADEMHGTMPQLTTRADAAAFLAEHKFPARPVPVVRNAVADMVKRVARDNKK